MKFNKVRVNILDGRIHVYVIWGDQAQAIKWLKKNAGVIVDKEKLDSGYGHYFRSERHYCLPIIYIRLPEKDKRFLSCVSHEAVHSINCIWDYIGEDSKEEVYAYSVEAIMRAIEKRIR